MSAAFGVQMLSGWEQWLTTTVIQWINGFERKLLPKSCLQENPKGHMAKKESVTRIAEAALLREKFVQALEWQRRVLLLEEICSNRCW